MKSWKNTVIGQNASMVDAIMVLEKEAQRIVLIADEEGRLLGVVADGDVRRAILAGKTQDSSISEVMTRNPVSVSESVSEENVLSQMRAHDIFQIPILDNKGRITGLHTIQDLSQKPKRDNPVFIMAGGFGKRLRPLTDNVPKPMLKIGDRPILQIILESFIDGGFHDFIISTHYLPDAITDFFGDGSNWDVSVRYVHEIQPLGTGGALGLLSHDEMVDLPLIMTNGDVLTEVDYARLLEFHNSRGGIATMGVREYEMQVPYGVVETVQSELLGIVEKPVHKFFVNAGIYVISPELRKKIPKNTKVDMPDLLRAQKEKGERINTFPLYESWLDIGRKEDLEKAQREAIDIR